ncbi:MAG: DUF1439 domain-containing protein [Methylophilaceae bacterium]|nr:DUF1439 domain-containing protein [Methylophilaceae bacterium]
MSSLRFVRLFLLVSLTTFITACASGPRSVSITESEIQQRMTEQLSVPITLLKIFDISLTNPVIRLDEGTERLNAQMDTVISNPLSGEPLTGKINISGKLQFDAARSAVVLVESKIDNLNIQGTGLDDKYSELFNLLVAKLGGELLNNVPLYTLKPDDLRVGNTRYTPSQFNIVGRELKITLQPQ